jgi:hypothetical protein
MTPDDDSEARRFRALTDRTVRGIEAARFSPGDRVRIVENPGAPAWVGRIGTVLYVQAGGLWRVRVALEPTYTSTGDLERGAVTINVAGRQIVKITDEEDGAGR